MKILFAGRLVDFKDPIMFINAARIMNYSDKTPRHKFIVAGNGLLYKQLLNLITYSNNGETRHMVSDIVLLGWVPPENVNQLMSEADVFCQLSPVENIWASTLISAMKHRKAIIVTDAGFTSKYFEDGYNALLVPPRNHVRLIKAINMIDESAELKQRLGFNAFKFYEQNLTPEEIAKQIRTLLFEVTEVYSGRTDQEIQKK